MLYLVLVSNLQVYICEFLMESYLGYYITFLYQTFAWFFYFSVRPNFQDVMSKICEVKIPVASIDVPSGWDVEQGDIHGTHLNPDFLISLTAPKLCSTSFRGRFHYLGGRFVPRPLSEKYHLQLPAYPGCNTFVRLLNWIMRIEKRRHKMQFDVLMLIVK